MSNSHSRDFIRRKYTASPGTGSYLIPNVVSPWAAIDFLREAKLAGFTVERHEMLECGIKGWVAYLQSHDKGRTSGPVTYEIYYAGVPVYGVKLEPDDVTVNPAGWDEALAEHSAHPSFTICADRKAKEKIMICYCTSPQGVSVVRRVKTNDLANVEKTISSITEALMQQEEE